MKSDTGRNGNGNRSGSGSTHGRRRGVPVLEDFELVRVIGKGCAGRVSLIAMSARDRDKLKTGNDGPPYRNSQSLRHESNLKTFSPNIR